MNGKNRQSIVDHINAATEEGELEALVSVLGDERAQYSADHHILGTLVEDLATDAFHGRAA